MYRTFFFTLLSLGKILIAAQRFWVHRISHTQQARVQDFRLCINLLRYKVEVGCTFLGQVPSFQARAVETAQSTSAGACRARAHSRVCDRGALYGAISTCALSLSTLEALIVVTRAIFPELELSDHFRYMEKTTYWCDRVASGQPETDLVFLCPSSCLSSYLILSSLVVILSVILELGMAATS